MNVGFKESLELAGRVPHLAVDEVRLLLETAVHFQQVSCHTAPHFDTSAIVAYQVAQP